MQVLEKPVTHVAVGGAVLALDLLTGPFLMFPIMFVLPVTFAGWYCGRRLAMALAVILPVARACIAALVELPHPFLFVLANAIVRVFVLLLIAYLVSRTATQTRELSRRVKLLEDLMPICCFCKRIRDERNDWQQLESYITRHSGARFSHTFCPECGKKHYGELLDEAPGGSENQS